MKYDESIIKYIKQNEEDRKEARKQISRSYFSSKAMVKIKKQIKLTKG